MPPNPTKTPKQVEVESVIAGDLLFRDSRRPDVVDFQQFAFAQAMRQAYQVSSDSDRELGRVLFMFDQVGGWADHLAPRVTRRRKRSPRLTDIREAYSLNLLQTAKRFSVPPNIIEAVPEEKLKQALAQALDKRDRLKLQHLQLVGVRDPESDSEDQDESLDDDEDLIVRCRGVATALFMRACNLDDGRRASIIRAYFQRDPVDERRVDLQVIHDGAVAAQTLFGVEAAIRTYFYIPISSMGSYHEQIHAISDGRIEVIKS